MKNGMVTKLMNGAAILLALLLATACSEQSTPFAPGTDAAGGTVLGRSSSSGSTELFGRVATVDSGNRTITLTGSSITIEVLEGAEIVSRSSGVETPIMLDDINPGDSAEIRGNMNGSDLLIADRVRIKLDDNNGAGEVEISGRIQSVDPSTRLIMLLNESTPIVVAATAEIVQKVSGLETPITLDDLAPGDSLDVRGASQADGSILADRVRLRMSDDDDDFVADLEFKSTITAIDYTNGTLTVEGRSETITTDASTFIYTSDDIAGEDDHGSTPAGKISPGDDDNSGPDGHRTRMAIQFTDLSVGDTIEVHANVVDASTLYAVAIELEDGAFEANLEVQFKATIASIDVTTRTVTFDGKSFSGIVDDNADLQDLANATITLDAFAVGNLVEVKGFKTDDQTINIVRMHMDNN